MSITRQSAAFALVALLCVQSSALAGESLRVVSQNMNRFFDNVDNGKREKVVSSAQFHKKVNLAAEAIIHQFRLAQIIALQEVENRNVLDAIKRQIKLKTGIQYQSVLLPGNDISGINNAFLLRPEIKIQASRQLFAELTFNDGSAPLFSRPPLYIETCLKSACLSLLNLHLRSMRGIRKASSTRRVSLKRHAQASEIARWVDQFNRSREQDSLLILGDFNALSPSDQYVDVFGIILGAPDNSEVAFKASDWISRDSTDLTRGIPLAARFSYVFRGKKQALDYMVANAGFKPVLNHIGYSRIDYRLSDHAALIADFTF